MTNYSICTTIMITREKIIEQLETVLDPEVGVDIWTMGLIYGIDIIDDRSVHILMTFTTPMCPAGPELQQEVVDVLRAIGLSAVDIELTFEPAWKPSRELSEALGLPQTING